ncbi:MAG: hypothetical protein Q8O55_01465 [Dehalococcoidales bacterium]|nr:hypothetical protein [Dehalococcoidales bacterium]
MIDILGILRRIMNANALETFDPATDSLEAIRDFIAAMSGGITLDGEVTAVPGAAQFTIPTLLGHGAGAFTDINAPWWVLVFRDAGGAGAAPQGEMQPITAYVTATGVFTTSAFTVAVGIGDHIIIMNPVLATIGRRIDVATLDDLSDIMTSSNSAKLRRILNRLSTNAFTATIQGVAQTELDTMLAQLAVYFNLAGAVLGVTMNPGAGSRANLQLIFQDLADMLAGATGIVIWPVSAAPGNGVSIAEALGAIYDGVVAANSVFQEQADTAVNVNAALAEVTVFDLSVAATRYIVRSLRLKSVDPVAETVTVRLYELINDVLILVDTFAITTANAGTYHSLMDMFGMAQLAGDNLKVTVIATAVGPFAVTGQYSHALST